MKSLLLTTFVPLCQRIAPVLLLVLAQSVCEAAPFTINGDGTVTDSATKLVWDQCPYGLAGPSCATGTALENEWLNALDAAGAANTASYKGFSDWRVPNKNELESIADVATFNPAIDTTIFPGTPNWLFWTSTTYATDAPLVWTVTFASGGTFVYGKSNAFYVRLVRSGQFLASFDSLLGTQAAVTLTSTSANFGASLPLTGGGGTGTGNFIYSVNSAGTAGCSITGGTTLTATAAGTCTVTATKGADSNYNAASSSATTVTFGLGTQAAVTLTSTSGSVGTPLALTGGGGTGTGAFSYGVNSAGTAGCAISGSTSLTATAVGTCVVTATKGADSNYNAASSSSTTVTFGAGTQTIIFGAAPSVIVGGTGTVSTTGGGSDIARVYASTAPAACTVNSSTGVVTGVAAGTNNCTITADQAGDSNYSAAPQVSQSFSIGQISQTITFGSAPTIIVGGNGTVSTTGGGSGIARVYASSTPTACTVNSSTGVVTGVAAGSNNCTITANQPGDSNYSAAAQVSQTFSINPAPPPDPISQTITFGTAPTIIVGGTGTVSTTGGGSGIARVYASATVAACTVNSSTGVVTGVAAGTNNCTITANQAGNASYSAAPQASQSFSIGQISQTITFGTVPTIIVGGTGSVSTTGGGSGIARVYASATAAACTVNSSTGVVTGVAAGTNNCTITADQAGNTNYSAAVQASLSFSIGAAPPPTPSIALLPVTIAGMSALPAILNMADAAGPDLMAALVGILSNTLGQPLQFVEQNANGTVILRGFNGGNLAFIPYGFQTGDNRADGIYPVGNGQYQVVRNGQQISMAPTLVSLNQLTALLPGIVASQAGNGVITATLNGVTYVVQAGAGVQLDPAHGAAQLVVAADGPLHFIDAQGNNQVLYPAFSEPGALRNLLRGLDLGSTLSIQFDGTAVIVLNGQRYTLVPDMTLLAVPAERAGQDWWQEGATRYRVTNVETLPFRAWSQGFTVRPQ